MRPTPPEDDEILSETPPRYPSAEEIALAERLLKAIEDMYLGHREPPPKTTDTR